MPMILFLIGLALIFSPGIAFGVLLILFALALVDVA